MPGIYVNDGGGLQSALGQALGGLAKINDPQTIAEAQKLKYDTEAVDIANQKAAEEWRSRVNAANNNPALLGQSGALPSGGQTTGGILAGQAVPPPDLIGNLRHPAQTVLSTNPLAAQTQDWTLSGQTTPDALKNSIIPLGQTLTTGPGTDITTQTEIAKARGMPYDLASGTSRHFPGVDPNAPEKVVSGGSPYGETVDKTTGASNPAALEADIRGGQAATVNHGKAAQALAIFDQYVAPNADPAGVLSEEAVRKLSEVTGLNFTRLTNADAKAQIKQLFLSMVGSLRDTQGNPLPRDSMDNIRSQFPDPDADPVRFKSMTHAILTALDQQAKDGQAAFNAYKTKTPEAYLEYLRQKGVNADAARQAFEQAGIDIRQGKEEPEAAAPPDNPRAPHEPPPKPEGGSPPPALRPATQQEIIFARNAIAKGRSRDEVIAHARTKGFDLGPNF